jgi:hypothetical protein
MVYTPPTNIPLGTYVNDGVRSGPKYSNLNSTATDSNGQLIAGYYDRYGPSVLYTPFNTWDIVPYASTAGNIVAAAIVAAPGYRTLFGDNAATTIVQGNNGANYVQLDWPRVPSVVVAGAAMTGPTIVTIFGTDWYGFPLQHAYTVEATGSYPANLATPAKAFYRITSVYVNNSTGAGGTLAVETSNIFGLPYVIKEASYAANFSWDGQGMAHQYGTATLAAGAATVLTPAVRTASPIFLSHQGLNGTATTDVGNLYVSAVATRTSFAIASTDAQDATIVSWMIPNSGQNLIAVADTSTATATTGDVRGLVQIPAASAPNAARRLVYTPYVFGADQFQNQLAAGKQPQGTGAVPPATNTVPNLTSADLYGKAQYYTGSL